MYWGWQDAPGRTASVEESADFDRPEGASIALTRGLDHPTVEANRTFEPESYRTRLELLRPDGDDLRIRLRSGPLAPNPSATT